VNVCLASYQSAILLKGGPRTQILQTKRELEKLNVNVSLFDSWQEFRKDNVDLVHLFGANIGTYHLARELRKLGVPMVVSPIFYSRHSSPVIRSFVATASLARRVVRGVWIDHGLAAEICRWAQAVLPNTTDEARKVEKGLGIPAERITVVPNGVDERFYGATPTAFVERYGVENFVLNVGHVGPGRKNVLRFIQALERITAPAVIIGRVEDNSYGRACVAEAKKNPRLLILDHLPNDSELLASAYAACDVFALPSMFETPGIAALEAGLAGAKVVITKYGGTREYFQDDAEYVEPTSVELIHHGIVTALNKPKHPALRERILATYTWDRVAQQTLAAYTKVLNGR
jgi:glycosyltransferase involved in cell wall biosynthesis